MIQSSIAISKGKWWYKHGWLVPAQTITSRFYKAQHNFNVYNICMWLNAKSYKIIKTYTGQVAVAY